MAHGVNANLLRKWIAREQVKHAMRVKRSQPARASLLAVEISPVAEAPTQAPIRPQSQAPQEAAQSIMAAAPKQRSPAPVPPPVPLTPACLGSRQAALAIEIGGARIVVESAAFDRAALCAVIDCLRESGAT